MTTSDTVLIRVLDKEYQVQCPPEEKHALQESAQALDQRMRDIRKSGHVIGLERIAVMAALNLAYDLLKTEAVASAYEATRKDLKRLEGKLVDALAETGSA